MTLGPVDEAFADLRVAGSVLVHEGYDLPFAIDVPDEAELRRMLGADPTVRVLPFHLVWKGSIELTGTTRRSLHVPEREVVICVGGAPHRIGNGKGATPVPLARVLARPRGRDRGSAPSSVECICGVFQLKALPLNPLLASLPPVLKISTADAVRGPLLGHAVEMLAIELTEGRQQSFTALRLLEILCAEAIRAYRHAHGTSRSWLRGVADPKIGPAIARVHEQPGDPWTVASMASTVAMSPSRFAARFRETTGKTAMAYVTEWRIHVACRALQTSEAGVSEVASAVGYGDVAAFGRAFKAHVGQSPARWRAAASAHALRED